jgi:hypothetical protein
MARTGLGMVPLLSDMASGSWIGTFIRTLDQLSTADPMGQIARTL